MKTPESQTKARAAKPPRDAITQLQRQAEDWSRNYAARSIRYYAKNDSFTLEMISGIRLTIPRAGISEFDGAPSKSITGVTIGIGDDVIECRALDVDIFIPGLLRDILGLNTGQRIGGLAKTPAKAKAARQNGRLGGRPPAAKKRSAKAR
jgi:hypothetical protein